jgi:hypothetical protein
MPTLTGVRVADFDTPRSELLAPPALLDFELLPHEARISPLQARMASAVFRRALEPIIGTPSTGRTPGKSLSDFDRINQTA